MQVGIHLRGECHRSYRRLQTNWSKHTVPVLAGFKEGSYDGIGSAMRTKRIFVVWKPY